MEFDESKKVELEKGDHHLAVNTKTNLVYVSCNKGDSIVIVDGSTHSLVDKIKIKKPWKIRVNEQTNTLYVVSEYHHLSIFGDGGKAISVIDCSSNQITHTINEKDGFHNLAINSVTNKIYACQVKSDTILVIDGSSKTPIEKIKVGEICRAIGINTKTNQIFACSMSGLFGINAIYLSVIDASSNTIQSVESKSATHQVPFDVFVNPNTNMVYTLTNFVVKGKAGNSKGAYLYSYDPQTNKFLDKVLDGLGVGPNASLDIVNNRIYLANVSDALRRVQGEMLSLNENLEVLKNYKFQPLKRLGSKWDSLRFKRILPTSSAVNSVTNKVYFTGLDEKKKSNYISLRIRKQIMIMTSQKFLIFSIIII